MQYQRTRIIAVKTWGRTLRREIINSRIDNQQFERVVLHEIIQITIC